MRSNLKPGKDEMLVDVCELCVPDLQRLPLVEEWTSMGEELRRQMKKPQARLRNNAPTLLLSALPAWTHGCYRGHEAHLARHLVPITFYSVTTLQQRCKLRVHLPQHSISPLDVLVGL